jgi:hypothetical protein
MTLHAKGDIQRARAEAPIRLAELLGPKPRGEAARIREIERVTGYVLSRISLRDGDVWADELTLGVIAYEAAVRYAAFKEHSPRRGRPTKADVQAAGNLAHAITTANDWAAFVPLVKGGLYLDAVSIWDGRNALPAMARATLADA